MKNIILDALAVKNSMTGVGQYIEELLKELLPLSAELSRINSASEYSFILLVKPDLNSDHSLLQLVNKAENCSVITLDIPAIGIMRDIAFLRNKGKLKYDLFHCLYSNHPLFLGGRQIVTIHDLKYLVRPEFLGKKWRLKSLYLRMIMKNAVRKCKKIIAVSQYTKNDLVNAFYNCYGKAYIEDKTKVIHEAASLLMMHNDELYKNQNLGEKYFLYLGELRPHKNIDKLIEAFVLFKKDKETEVAKSSNVRLLIVGKKHSSFTHEKENLPEGVVFTGYVADKDKYTLYHNALALCFPSLYEGFGLPVLEAMKGETAVITSNFSSTAEIGKDSALLVNPESVGEIAQAMKKIFMDKDFREMLIKKGKLREKEFSWRKAAEETLEVYKEILE